MAPQAQGKEMSFEQQEQQRRDAFQAAYTDYRKVTENSDEGKLLKKAKDNPMVPIGITGGLAALGYSIYKFKKSDTKLSLYLIHTRVAAQGAVVGALTLGVMYNLFQEYVLHKKPSS